MFWVLNFKCIKINDYWIRVFFKFQFATRFCSSLKVISLLLLPVVFCCGWRALSYAPSLHSTLGALLHCLLGLPSVPKCEPNKQFLMRLLYGPVRKLRLQKSIYPWALTTLSIFGWYLKLDGMICLIVDQEQLPAIIKFTFVLCITDWLDDWLQFYLRCLFELNIAHSLAQMDIYMRF